MVLGTHLPRGKQGIGCKWVFVVNVNHDASVACLKVCLFGKRYAQTYGVHYPDTFSLMAKLVSIQLFLSLVFTNDWPLHQFDVTFLHGDLQE